MGRTELAKAFEAALAQAGYEGSGCVKCGELTRFSQSILIVEHGNEPPRCKGCGLMLDPKGRPVGMRMTDGRIESTLLVLEPSPPIIGEFADRGSE